MKTARASWERELWLCSSLIGCHAACVGVNRSLHLVRMHKLRSLLPRISLDGATMGIQRVEPEKGSASRGCRGGPVTTLARLRSPCPLMWIVLMVSCEIATVSTSISSTAITTTTVGTPTTTTTAAATTVATAATTTTTTTMGGVGRCRAEQPCASCLEAINDTAGFPHTFAEVFRLDHAATRAYNLGFFQTLKSTAKRDLAKHLPLGSARAYLHKLVRDGGE
jgi:hypothetical protein